MNEHDATELAYKRGYEDGKQDAMKWIPVTERLPTKEDGNGKGHILAFCKKEGFVNKWKWDTVVKYRKIFSHWMHMPQEPKGD